MALQQDIAICHLFMQLEAALMGIIDPRRNKVSKRTNGFVKKRTCLYEIFSSALLALHTDICGSL